MKYYAIALVLLLQGCTASGPYYPPGHAIYLERNEYHPHYAHGNWQYGGGYNRSYNITHKHEYSSGRAYGRR